jgi:alpha/beta superfamily hydrolase
MHNNVICGLADGLAQLGFVTLRFDFRGVGRSQGPEIDVARYMAEFWQTSHVPGEMDLSQDLQGAAQLMRQAAPGVSLALVGYSFGCALVPYVRPQEDLAALVLISPTVAKHDYDSFRRVNRPLLVIASEDDFATDAKTLDEWFSKLSMPRQMIRQRCDNHFFRGHEGSLTERVYTFLEGHLGVRT